MGSDVDGVALELTRLTFPLVSRHPCPALLDPAVRAAVLIDLAISGALVDAGAGLEVDTTRTGFVVADRLLAAILERPDKPLVWWLYHAPIGVHDVADVLVAQGHWDRHGPLRHYRDLHPDATASRMRHLSTAARRTGRPIEAILAALLGLLPMPGHRFRSAAFTGEYGSAAWIVPDLIAELGRRQAVLGAAADDARFAQSATFIV